MSSVEYLRAFVNERLTAAAEEIFGVFQQTIVEYKEEIDRQRRLLDIFWKPEIKLHRTEVPQQHVGKKEEVLADQQLCIQERNSSVDQEDPDPPRIKEEQEELCTPQEEEQLVLKQETSVMTPTYEKSDHGEDQSLNCVVPEPHTDHQLCSHNCHVAESRDQKGGEHGDSGSARGAKPEHKNQHHESRSHSNNRYNSTMSETHCIHSHAGKRRWICDACGKDFKFLSKLQRHLRIHTGEKPYTCNTCGKRFAEKAELTAHVRIHTGVKPYSCKTCGRGFYIKSQLQRHFIVHTGEKPYTCNTCGLRFSRTAELNFHIRIHTGERPHSCKTCGKDFRYDSGLKAHMRIHTGEKPYLCNTCRKSFSCTSTLNKHMRIHTNEKLYTCNT